MSVKPLAASLAGFLMFCFAMTGAAAQQPTIPSAAWQAYVQKFMDHSGRIVDDGNGGISHSEGQGYGMLLAVLADDAPTFELIWSFTRTELLLRDDGLVAWKWSPTAQPHVTDINNATDGDILIAYALGLAGEAWKRSDYTAAGSAIAHAILAHTIVEVRGTTLLLPGASGFAAGERADGPVINPSYWVFEAFPVLDRLAPSPVWTKLRTDGLALLRQLRFGPKELPADWVSMASSPAPAAGFPAEYGYNALRIPLYLARAGVTEKAVLDGYLRATAGEGSNLTTIDLPSGKTKDNLSDPGYRIINHILACLTQGTVAAGDSKSFTPTLYYPSTLHLLGLSFLAARRPECL